jgi:hypothetical protein
VSPHEIRTPSRCALASPAGFRPFCCAKLTVVEFEITQRIEAPRAAVETLLRDADFVGATSDLHPLADCRLLDTEQTGDRWHTRIHRRFAASLPPAVTAVIDPRRLTWVEEGDYDSDTHRGEHRILPDHYPKLLTCSWRTTVTQTGDTTTRVAAGTLRARVLLGARPVERAIVSGLEQYSAAEACLLAEWAARTRN